MAVSLELFAAFRNGDRSIMQFLWIFVAGPFGGGFVASIFYEAIYKRLVKNLWYNFFFFKNNYYYLNIKKWLIKEI